MSTAEFAQHVDLTQRHVQQLIADGTITGSGRGFVAMPVARVEYIRFLRRAQERADNGIGQKESGEMAQLRLERQRIALDRERMEFHKDAGALIALADATRPVVLVVEAVRTTLQRVPRKHGNSPEDRARLKKICAEALNAAISASTRALQTLVQAGTGHSAGDVSEDDE